MNRVFVKSPKLPSHAWVVGFISLEQTSSVRVPFCGKVRINGLYHGIRTLGPWTMLGLSSYCTRVWTIVLHVRGRVNSPTLSSYVWIVGFISLEQTSSFKVHFVEE
jgi:hypothetical protein